MSFRHMLAIYGLASALSLSVLLTGCSGNEGGDAQARNPLEGAEDSSEASDLYGRGSDLYSPTGTWVFSAVVENGTEISEDELLDMGFTEEDLDMSLVFGSDGTGVSYTAGMLDNDTFSWSAGEDLGKRYVTVVVDGDEGTTMRIPFRDDGRLELAYDVQELMEGSSEANVQSFSILLEREK